MASTASCCSPTAFDGARTGVADADGLPPDGRVGPFRIGPYDRPQTIQASPRKAPIRVELPPGRYSALHVLGATGNGAAMVPVAIAYDDGGARQQRSEIRFADWLEPASPAGFGLDEIGMPVVTGMDRLGPRGMEPRDAVRLFDRIVPMDPTRVARAVVFLFDQARGSQSDTVVNVLALTLVP